jgi:hypothetical protein
MKTILNENYLWYKYKSYELYEEVAIGSIILKLIPEVLYKTRTILYHWYFTVLKVTAQKILGNNSKIQEKFNLHKDYNRKI